MLSSSTRLLRVLSLMQTRSHWAGPELAERLQVHPRTLRRDIDRLRQLGYPIHASSGVAGGYAFRAGQSLPPLLLDDEEALAVADVEKRRALMEKGEQILRNDGVTIQPYWRSLFNHTKENLEGGGHSIGFFIWPGRIGWTS